MQEENTRESIEVDVLIIGAGPAGLATAIKLKTEANKNNQEINIVVLEKGSGHAQFRWGSLTGLNAGHKFLGEQVVQSVDCFFTHHLVLLFPTHRQRLRLSRNALFGFLAAEG